MQPVHTWPWTSWNPIYTMRPNKINFINDGFSAEKNWASKQFFFFAIPQKWSERRSDNFFFLIFCKNGASKGANIFFKRKKRNTAIIFRQGEKKNWCLQTKMERRNNNKKLEPAKKKMERQNNLFLIKNFNHGIKIEAANPSYINFNLLWPNDYLVPN